MVEEGKALKIAMIGTRGVPANYGGFETCIEEIGQRLSAKGHKITVYCRRGYYRKKLYKYKGMKLVYLPNFKTKSLDTMSHTIISVIHALFMKYDVYAVFNAANSFFLFPLKFFNKKIIINTDGLEWKRSKWGFWGKKYYKLAEKFSCIMANRLVSDSPGIKDYYKKCHRTESTHIAYGAYVKEPKKCRKLKELNLEPNSYFLQITRFEPENHPLLTAKAFKKLKTDKKLVIVGGNPYPNSYTREIESEQNENVILPGYIYDEDLLGELWYYSYAYIHGNSVGGTNPALLQTMAAGCFTIAIDNDFNRDVLLDCGIYYKNNIEALEEKMRWALMNERKLENYKRKAQDRIKNYYTWEKISGQYEKLFYDVLRKK